jgi:hypothetical protein
MSPNRNKVGITMIKVGITKIKVGNSLLITLRLAGSKTKGDNLDMNYFQVSCNMYRHTYRYTSGRRDRMVGGCTTTVCRYMLQDT